MTTTPTLSERLRNTASATSWAAADALMDEAATELDRLRAENALLLGLIRRALPMADALDATRTAVVWTGDLQVDATLLAKTMRAAIDAAKAQP